ncbi:MAG TPA: DUF1697 domain-containing protein [Acidimicrobiales bacterium]|jgi:uncharacterized protein (DUF1697 family)|nr:DUF1697 domain-containing protein [Acidimicrobiales bacterium]
MTTRLVALLRGINVGHNKRVAMNDLRGLLAVLGYTDVSTYLQSGNAVFTCADAAAPTAAADIERALSDKAGVECRVVVRSAGELAAAAEGAPLLDVMTDPSRYLVGFLDGEPDPAGARSLAALDVAPDQVRLLGREVYLWCPAGVLASPLNKLRWAKLLGVDVTMRNWNTVRRLVALAGGNPTR